MATALPQPLDAPRDDADAPASATAAPPERCASCGAARGGRFCAECGEKRVEPRDYTLRHVLSEVADHFMSLDGRLLRTMRALALRPGFLTVEYLAGRRRMYSKPLSLFVLINVAFFFAAPYVKLLRWSLVSYIEAPAIGVRDTRALVHAKIGAHPPRGASMDSLRAHEQREVAYRIAFNAAHEAHKRSLLIFIVPGFALVVAALEWRRRRTYVEHLVFSVHAIAWVLLFLLVGIPLVEKPLWEFVIAPLLAGSWEAARSAPVDGYEDTLGLFIMIGLAGSLWFALRRVYGDGLAGAAIKATVLSFSFMVLIQLYRSVLFYLAYYTG